MIGYLISQQGISVVWWLFVFDHFETWHQFNTLYNQFLWTRLAVDLVLNICIVTWFCRRILNLTVSDRDMKPQKSPVGAPVGAPKGTQPEPSEPSQSPKIENSPSFEFKNEHSPKIYDAMIKYFTLCSWTVLSTQIFTVTQLLLSDSIQHAVDHDEFGYYYTAYIFHYGYGNVDAMISTAFVVLSFSFSGPIYSRVCGCAHSKCLWIWDTARVPTLCNTPMPRLSSLSLTKKERTTTI